MKKSKAWKIILFVVTVCLVASMLCACDMLETDDSSEQKEKTNGNGGKLTEPKINLSEAVKNYEELEVKRSDIDAGVSLEFYQPDGNNGEFKTAKLGVRTAISRIQNDEKIYDTASIMPGEVTNDVNGILATIRGFCDGTGLITKLKYNELTDDVKEKLLKILPYIDFVQGFLKGKVACKADVGYFDETINLKAEYAFDKGTEGKEKKKIWCGASTDGLSSVISDKMDEELISDLLIEPFLDLVVAMGGEDKASARVNTEGVGVYNITPKMENATKAVEEVLANIFKILGIEMNAELKSNLLGKIGEWVTIENDSAVNVIVGKDKLPSSLDYKLKVTFNLPITGEGNVKATIASMRQYGLNDEAASLINSLVAALGVFMCGSNGEPNKIGFSLVIDLKEKFRYTDNECSLSGIDADLFVPLSEEKEGRLDLDAKFATIDKQTALKFADKIGEKIGGEEGAEISAGIKVKINATEKINIVVIKDIVVDVLEEYVEAHADFEFDLNDLFGVLTVKAEGEGDVSVNE